MLTVSHRSKGHFPVGTQVERRRYSLRPFFLEVFYLGRGMGEWGRRVLQVLYGIQLADVQLNKTFMEKLYKLYYYVICN